ncbi:hypothetical protein [Methanoregula sp.]|uniref:hypothetical protein n=1 Tax=Methanoregula sp. TaxID=2052170 RepID=UPI00236EDB61|nr:hypothetical protein [Methanoregula sp.]MDD1686245.1 hypothetical protein [Methanoregula sp.]
MAIENFFRIDRTLMKFFSADFDENFRSDLDVPFKKIFDAPGAFAPAAWASPGCDDAALPGYHFVKYTEQVIPGHRKRPRPLGAGWRKGGGSPSKESPTVERPDPDPLFLSEIKTPVHPSLSYAPVLALFADHFLRRENGEKRVLSPSFFRIRPSF